jgi:hypothetical protein
VPVRARDEVGEPALAVAAQPQGGGEDVLELVDLGRRRDVEHRALHGGDRHAASARDIATVQAARAVYDDAFAAASPTRRGHVDCADWLCGKAPPRGSAAVTEHGARPAGKHRRQRSTVATDVGVTDGINRAVQPVQTPRTQPMVDRVAFDPEAEELLQ